MDEIQDLIPGFRAELASIIGKHRQFNGAGTVDAFAKDLTQVRTRYAAALESIRVLNPGKAQVLAACDACETQIAAITASEIERARTLGKVEFAA
jgi:hypothetical protein